MRYLFFFLIIFSANSCKERKVNISKQNSENTTHSKSNPTKTVIKSNVLDYDKNLWNEITDSGIKLDLRYATTNNFVKKQMYKCPRCFLRPEVALEIIKINKILKTKGLQLKLFDCYRPRPIQQQLWDIKPDARYVTPPSRGSMHNRGMAVDLTITDIDGIELDMGTEFDYFGIKAYHTTVDLPAEVLKNRLLLKSTMESHGFKSIRTEWWHYSYTKKSYPLSDWVWGCN